MLNPRIRVTLVGAIAIATLFLNTPLAQATVQEVRKCLDPKDEQTCVIMLVDDGKKPQVKINEGTLPLLRGDEPSPTDEPPAQGAIANMCDWRRMEPQPPSAADPRWGGLDPATHIVLTRDCDENTEYTVIAADLVLPPPDPAVVAEMAIDSLTITDPSPHFGPDTVQAVNRRTYLWVDNPGPLTATAELRGVSVTATAELTSVEWSMGEPLDTRGSSSGQVPAFTCAGAAAIPASVPTRGSINHKPPTPARTSSGGGPCPSAPAAPAHGTSQRQALGRSGGRRTSEPAGRTPCSAPPRPRSPSASGAAN
jgi:hypothetical protein